MVKQAARKLKMTLNKVNGREFHHIATKEQKTLSKASLTATHSNKIPQTLTSIARPDITMSSVVCGGHTTEA